MHSRMHTPLAYSKITDDLILNKLSGISFSHVCVCVLSKMLEFHLSGPAQSSRCLCLDDSSSSRTLKQHLHNQSTACSKCAKPTKVVLLSVEGSLVLSEGRNTIGTLLRVMFLQ